MKLIQALAVTTLLLATGVSLAPPASADTCIVFDPTVDAALCGTAEYVGCLRSGGVKELPKRLALCDAVLLP